MEFGTKVRMARNGIGMSTGEFAELCGLSAAGLNKIERLEGNPNTRTIYKIERVLNSLGWKLIDNGVVQEDQIIVIYEDYIDVLDDVLNTLESGQEVLFHRADDRRSSAEVLSKLKELKDKGIKFKSNICEGNTFVTGNLDDYRQIDKEYFEESDEVEAIYADRFMVHERTKRENGKEEHRYFVIKSKQLANTKRKDFYYWWRKGKCLTA
jgi:transcriptional regulator with XRE-family HTH domain